MNPLGLVLYILVYRFITLKALSFSFPTAHYILVTLVGKDVS